MSANDIVAVNVLTHILTPAQAEVWIQVVSKQQTSRTEVRGRLMGPRCPYASTIEVAYPFRPLVHPLGEAAPGIWRRVIIPEPSWWEPETPFLYGGPVELWEDGEQIAQVTARHGLRSWRMGADGLYLNGRRYPLRGVAVHGPQDENRLAELRGRKINLLHATGPSPSLCERADRFGFLVLANSSDTADHRSPSFLGFLWPEKFLAGMSARLPSLPDMREYLGVFVGAELDRNPLAPLPDAVSFVACREELLTQLADIGRPRIVLTQSGECLERLGGIMGWIECLDPKHEVPDN